MMDGWVACLKEDHESRSRIHEGRTGLAWAGLGWVGLGSFFFYYLHRYLLDLEIGIGR